MLAFLVSPNFLILLAVLAVAGLIGYVAWASRRPTFKKNTTRFFGWGRETLDFLCQRPDHLQRLGIIGAGMSVYPIVLALIWIVWKGYAATPENQTQSLGIMGFALFGAMALFALVVVSLLGTIKGLSIHGPGGSGIEIKTVADDPDVGPDTPRETTVTVQQSTGRGRRRREPDPVPEGDISA